MDAELWQTLDHLFQEALQLTPDEYEGFIRAYSQNNKELEKELRSLLLGHGENSVLDTEIGTFYRQVEDQVEIEPLKRIGPYSIIRELGAGGMGVVYLAWHEQWKFEAAIKVPQGVWIAPQHRTVFEAEQQSLAQLIHPNIARILEGKTLKDGTPWFAMEYVDGERITVYCQRKSLSIRGRLRLFLEICEAVRYAHSKAVIHRDLKPSNILVTAEGKVKLLDFGIAKQVRESVNLPAPAKTAFNPLTLAYAAPEQILRGEVSSETDVYALGVVLYELLTGELPFTAEALKNEEILRTGEPRKPSAVSSRLPGLGEHHWADLDTLILKTIHKNTERRYRTVDALMQDVQRFLADEPLEAHPHSASYRLRKFLRRNQRFLSVAAAAVAFIVGLTIFFMVGLAKARNAAIAEAARARRVTQFTRAMLSGDDADNGPSKDMKVIDMLDVGLRKAEALRGDPLQQAQIYTTIGSIETNLAQFDKADAILHSAYRILLAHAPVSHEMSEVLLDLGILYSAESNDQHSLSCMRKALAVEQQITPPDRALLFRCRTGIAYGLLDSDPKAAVAILNNLMKQPLSDATDEARSDAENDLGTAYINMGEYEKAEPYARKVLAYSIRTKPAIHPDIAVSLINLSFVQRQLKDYSNAEQNLRKALAIDSAWYGNGHQETGDVKRLLANVLFLEKRYDDAMPLAREALADEQRAGTLNRRTAYAMQMVGVLDLHLKHSDLAEASTLFQQEIAILQSLKDPTNLPMAFNYLGDAYMAQKRYKQSGEAYRKALDLYGDSPVPTWDYQAQDRRKLAETLMLQGQFAAAEAPLLASYKLWITKPQSYADELRLAREDLVKVYQSLKRKAEVERFQQELRGAP